LEPLFFQKQRAIVLDIALGMGYSVVIARRSGREPLHEVLAFPHSKEGDGNYKTTILSGERL
jgi:hypothetical protein